MTDRQFIENTCKGTPSPDLCLEIPLANRESENANLTGLALIGLDAVQDRGFEILRQVVDLKNSQPELTPTLDICTEVYNVVVDSDVQSSREALRGGLCKFAEDGMADSAVEAQACERSFGEHGQSSPITDSNNIINDVANVVRAIIRMLL
ncbi:cell wall / vacuolar inhibitor of fructosidase 1 [Helianthus annuus]|nr:cell wall / vacuolar inhibitor of fructosidase 1 [Helianthus annuus]